VARRPMSVVLFLIALLGWFAVLVGVQFVAARGAAPAVVHTQAEYDSALATARGAALAGSLGWSYLTLGLIAPRVGYRTRDFLMVLIPLYGVFVFAPKLLWRWTGPKDKWASRQADTTADEQSSPIYPPPGIPEGMVLSPTDPIGPAAPSVLPWPAAPAQSLERPTPSQKGRGLRAWVYLLVIGVALASAAATFLAFRLAADRQPKEETLPTRTRTLTPSVSPQPNTGKQPEREVTADFGTLGLPVGVAQGEDLSLIVNKVASRSGCRTHRYGGLPVFHSDCQDWASSGFDLYFFYVKLQNTTSAPEKARLSNFAVVDSFGRAYAPIDVINRFDKPQVAFPRLATIPPHATVAGFLTFDAQLTFLPRSLSYFAGKQTLTIRFRGRSRVTGG
jgi:hypothetical protein